MNDYRNDIEKYLKGELSPAERHALEKKALSDPFLADALEGAQQLEPSGFQDDVAELQTSISGKANRSFWYWPLRIAAGVAILLASTFIVWMALETQPAETPLALEKHEAVQQEADSSDQSITPAPVPDNSSATNVTRSTAATTPRETSEQRTNENPASKQVIETPKAEIKEEEQPKVTQPIAAAADIKKEEGEAVNALEIETLKKEEVRVESVNDALTTPKAVSRKMASRKKVITGKVTSAEDGSPLPGVNVMLKGTTLGAITGTEGTFSFLTAETNPVLTFSFIGFQSTEINVADVSEINVSMEPSMAQLSEVVVTGARSVPTGSITDLAHPQIGYKAFKQYLQESVQYPSEAINNKIEGRVTVEFTVEPTGSLTNFLIKRSIGGGCEEELIRLIKEGPTWEPSIKDNVPVQDKVTVQLRFKLPD